MIPTDNRSPKVSELIEELEKHDPDLRVQLGVDQEYGGGPIEIEKAVIEPNRGSIVVLRLTQ